MRAHRWLGVSLAIGIAAAAFISCKGSSATPAGSSSSAATGTGGGTGGAGTGVSSGTGGIDDAGAILCLQQYTNIPKSVACDLLKQNCELGQTCVPALGANSMVTTACVTATGLKTAGESCYDATECDDKLICIGQNGDHPGQCVAFCCPAEPYEPCNGGICNEQVNFGNGAFAYVCSYGQRCTLLTPGACPPGYDCHVETAAGQGIAVCLEPSPSMVGELGTCNFINDCASMQDCFGLGGSGGGVCLYYCALTGPTMTAAPGLGGCPKDEMCQSMYKGQPVGTGVDGVGLCIPDAGIVPITDAGAGDAGESDAGKDAGAGDAGEADAGETDAGETDAGKDDAGEADAGEADAGKDAGAVDAGHDAGDAG
jgi:hypothetical protein